MLVTNLFMLKTFYLKLATCPSPEHTTSSPPITSEKAEADAGVAIDTQTLNLLYRVVKDNADENGWAYLGSIGQYLNNVKPDFDTRNYGRAKLSGFIKTLAVFETKIRRQPNVCAKIQLF